MQHMRNNSSNTRIQLGNHTKIPLGCLPQATSNMQPSQQTSYFTSTQREPLDYSRYHSVSFNSPLQQQVPSQSIPYGTPISFQYKLTQPHNANNSKCPESLFQESAAQQFQVSNGFEKQSQSRDIIQYQKEEEKQPLWAQRRLSCVPITSSSALNPPELFSKNEKKQDAFSGLSAVLSTSTLTARSNADARKANSHNNKSAAQTPLDLSSDHFGLEQQYQVAEQPSQPSCPQEISSQKQQKQFAKSLSNSLIKSKDLCSTSMISNRGSNNNEIEEYVTQMNSTWVKLQAALAMNVRKQAKEESTLSLAKERVIARQQTENDRLTKKIYSLEEIIKTLTKQLEETNNSQNQRASTEFQRIIKEKDEIILNLQAQLKKKNASEVTQEEIKNQHINKISNANLESKQQQQQQQLSKKLLQETGNFNQLTSAPLSANNNINNSFLSTNNYQNKVYYDGNNRNYNQTKPLKENTIAQNPMVIQSKKIDYSQQKQSQQYPYSSGLMQKLGS